jgi:endonuclease/exonuclease/phosphatase family metal-dependent hydrolase
VIDMANRIDRGGSWVTTLATALVVALLAQLVRAYMPLAFELGEEIGGTTGYLAAGAVALAVFSAPAIGAIGGFAGGGRTALVAAVGGLAAARLAIQLVHPIPIWLGMAAVVVGLASLPFVVVAIRRAADDAAVLAGVILGLALDTAIRGACWTWDLAWQGGAAPIIVVLALGAAAIVSTSRLPLAGPTPQPPALRLALFGPFLALQLLFLQNPAAAASQAEVSLPDATAIVLAGDALALGLLSCRLRIGPVVTSALTVLAAGGAYLLIAATGAPAGVLIVAEQAVLVLLLARATIPGPLQRERVGRVAGACALGSVVFALFVFLYEVQNEVTLPISNAVLLAVAAAVVGIGAIPRRGALESRTPRAAGALPIAFLVVPLAMAPGGQLGGGTLDDGTIRIVSYNIHGSVNVDGQLDPQATADVISAQEPDVVVLQEVARGWPIFGGIDAATWLSRRLDMPFLYVPAADGQFGSAILTRLPVLTSSSGELPFGAGPQQRSYLTALLDVGGGKQLTVIATHLQESSGDPDTRTQQIRTVLEAWGGTAPAVIAGDMNMQPGEDDVRLFSDAGLVSVQDEIGDPCEPSAFEPKPDKLCDRPDWIFATPDLGLSEFEIAETPASDHLPLAVTVAV